MPKTDFEIRPVHESEYAALGEITVEAYDRDGFLDGPDDPYADFLRDVAARASEAEVLVAAEGDRLLGGVTMVPPGAVGAQLAGAGEAEIRALAVDPAGRGRGVGTALTDGCIALASETFGAKRVVLCSLYSMKAAHRIYLRRGFRRAPELDWEPVPGAVLWGFALEL